MRTHIPHIIPCQEIHFITRGMHNFDQCHEVSLPLWLSLTVNKCLNLKVSICFLLFVSLKSKVRKTLKLDTTFIVRIKSPHNKHMHAMVACINSVAILDLYADACCFLWSDHIVKLQIANRSAWELLPYRLAGWLSTSGQGREVSMPSFWEGTTLLDSCHTETRSVEKYSPNPHTYQKGLKLLTGKEGWELDLFTHWQIDS